MSDKQVTPVDKYSFDLGDELKAIAENELRETEETREFALNALREWIEKNPKILKCRFDSNFLLRFLRCKKFSLPSVHQSLERYILLRQHYNDGIFINSSLNEPTILDLIDLGFLFPLAKRDKHGRRVVLARPGVFDLNKHTSKDILRAYSLTSEILIEDERNQICGFTYIGDASGFSLQHMSLFSPKEAIRLVKNGEQFVPMRHKQGICFNINPSWKMLTSVVEFGISLLSEKMRNRIKIFSKLEDCEDFDKSILPKEYGGEMPMAEMIELWKKEIIAAQEKQQNNDLLAVNVKLFTANEIEGHVSAINSCGAAPDDWSSLQGSFRKLEVD